MKVNKLPENMPTLLLYGSYTKCLYMSIYCSCWSGGSIVWSTHWNITYTPGTYLLQHVTTVSCRCFSSKFYNSIFLLCSSSSLILIFQESCGYSSCQLPESERTRNEGLRWAFFWYMQTRQTSLVATKKQWDFMLPKSIDHPQWAIRACCVCCPSSHPEYQKQPQVESGCK